MLNILRRNRRSKSTEFISYSFLSEIGKRHIQLVYTSYPIILNEMNEDKARIRYAKATDANDRIDLLEQLDRPSPRDRNQKRKFRMLIDSYMNSNRSDRGILIASIGSKVIALLSFILLERLNQYFTELWVPELVVSEEYRNKGIGIRLIKKCESVAQTKKCYRIRLESRNDRVDSHNFYKKLGF